MTYSVKEMYFTLQGEGAQTGRAAVFLRFAGCNLWNGLARDRESAICNFCDTDFVGTDGINGGKFKTPDTLVKAICALWPDEKPDEKEGVPYIVCTGGEPLLQLDEPLIEAFHEAGFEVGVETNGTLKAPDGLDWICVSPKADSDIVLTVGDELKLVFPQAKAPPKRFENMDFKHFFLQPLDSSFQPLDAVKEDDCQAQSEILKETIRYCLEHPKWRLSLQTHKLTGIP